MGWSMEAHRRTELVLGALNMAISQRRPEAVIHHSGLGSTRLELTAHASILTGSGAPCFGEGTRPLRELLQDSGARDIFADDYSTMDDVANRVPHFLEDVYSRRR